MKGGAGRRVSDHFLPAAQEEKGARVGRKIAEQEN